LQGLYQLLQDGSGHEEWIALWIDAIIRDATTNDMNPLSALRTELVDDPVSWQAKNPGQLAWIEMLEDEIGRRVDKLTYSVGGKTEFVLCVDNRHSTSLFYFADDFNATQAVDFLQRVESSFMEEMRAMRNQSNDRSDSPRPGM